MDKEGKIREIAYGDPFSIANFLTTLVLKGFTQELAMIIILGQILDLLSIKGEKSYFFPTTLGDSDPVAPVPSSDGNSRGAQPAAVVKLANNIEIHVKIYPIGEKNSSTQDFKAYNYHFLLRRTCISVKVFEAPWSQLL